jgi:type 1 glutamine amidotransferase
MTIRVVEEFTIPQESNAMRFPTAMIGCLGFLSMLAVGCQAPSQNINAVLWIGGFAHDFEPAAEIIADDLRQRMEIDIQIVDNAAWLDEPEAAKLDVIVMHHCFKQAEGNITEAQLQKLFALVRGGAGVVGLHASYYSFPEREDMRELFGTRFIKHGPSEAIAVVRTIEPDHAMMKGLTPSFEVTTEVYESEPLAESCQVLAMAKEKDKKAEHPSVWTLTYGEGRVVTILPAHWPKSFEQEDFQALIASGTLWAAGRK